MAGFCWFLIGLEFVDYFLYIKHCLVYLVPHRQRAEVANSWSDQGCLVEFVYVWIRDWQLELEFKTGIWRVILLDTWN